MAISYLGQSIETPASTNPLSGTYSLPTGARAGDLGVFFWYNRNFGKTYSGPAGVTSKLSEAPFAIGHIEIGYRWLQFGDTTWGWTANSVAGSPVIYGVAVFRCVLNAGDPFEATSGATVQQTFNSQNVTTPALTSLTDEALIVYVDGSVLAVGNSGISGWTIGFGAQSNAGSGLTLASVYKVGTTAGAYGGDTWSFAGFAPDNDHVTWGFALTKGRCLDQWLPLLGAGT